MKILLIRFSALGDVVLMTGVIEMIRKFRPDVEIEIATDTSLAPIFNGNPAVKKVYTVDKKSILSKYAELAHALPKFDHVFDLHGTAKSRYFAKHLEGQHHQIDKQSLVRRIFVKTGFLRSKLRKHVVEKYADAVLPELGIHNFTREDVRPYLTTSISHNKIKEQFNLPEKYVVLHPFASQKNKVWPHFSDLAKKLLEFNIPVVIIGQESSTWPAGVVDLGNKTSILEMCQVISQSQAIVTTDSGPMHIGLAYYRPTVALFGPTTKELGFMPDFKKAFVFENRNLNCRPCHIHGGNHCPKRHFLCMKSIEPNRVFSKVAEFF